MTAYPTRSLARRPLAALLALALAAVAVIVGAQPAFAHDSLISSDPAAGATVDALPATVTLAFSAVLLDEAGGTIVEVTDAAGTQLAEGDPVVDQNTVTQAIAGSATGEITVTWRVVSSDGHPVSDTFAFTVSGSASPSPTPTPTASPSASASEPAPTSTPSESATPLVTSAEEGSGVLPWVIGGIIAVVVIAVVVILLAARARQGKETARVRTEGRDDLGGR